MSACVCVYEGAEWWLFAFYWSFFSHAYFKAEHHHITCCHLLTQITGGLVQSVMSDAQETSRDSDHIKRQKRRIVTGFRLWWSMKLFPAGQLWYDCTSIIASIYLHGKLWAAVRIPCGMIFILFFNSPVLRIGCNQEHRYAWTCRTALIVATTLLTWLNETRGM